MKSNTVCKPETLFVIRKVFIFIYLGFITERLAITTTSKIV